MKEGMGERERAISVCLVNSPISHSSHVWDRNQEHHPSLPCGHQWPQNLGNLVLPFPMHLQECILETEQLGVEVLYCYGMLPLHVKDNYAIP